jgi:hypothetical protein
MACTVCPPNTTSAVGSTDFSGCVCPTGFNGAITELIRDFTPYDSLTSWKNYGTSIGATHFGLGKWWAGSGYQPSPGPYYDNCLRGSISFTMPVGYSQIIAFFGVGGGQLYFDGIVKAGVSNDALYEEYTQSITPGQVLKIDEGCNWIGSDLKFILRNGLLGIIIIYNENV